MNRNRYRKTMAYAIGLMVAFSAGPAWAVEGKTLQIDGSTTVGPIGDAFAEVFKELYSDVSVTVKKTGSGDGAAALIDGRCDIAMMSRFMKGISAGR